LGRVAVVLVVVIGILKCGDDLSEKLKGGFDALRVTVDEVGDFCDE
jgi:hypothetical protein